MTGISYLISDKITFVLNEQQLEFQDVQAAWELHVQLSTRVTTMTYTRSYNSEVGALASIYSIFESTRKILLHNGYECFEFSKLALVMLNDILREFCSYWHSINMDQRGLSDYKYEFEDSIIELQGKLRVVDKICVAICKEFKGYE